jgi:hypothetical protein
MQKANKEFLQSIEELANKRKNEILNTKDEIVIKGTTYYVASNGNDNNDGLTPNTPWQTTQKVSSYPFKVGDGCCFRRGDVFRGFIKTKPGVTYFAYGTGDKPKLYGWDYNLADKSLWTLVDDKNNIYKLNNKILDCGTLVFDNDKTYSYKHIPSYIDGKFVCRNAHHKDFIMQDEMNDLDIFWRYDERFSTTKSKGEDFPVPIMDNNSYGDLYLKCDKGNPGEVFTSIEPLTRRSGFIIDANKDVTIDNFCIKYVGFHGIAAFGDLVEGLTVTNCELGWIGGTIQSYLGNDLNYLAGRRGEVTRFGNAIEIYGGCKNYTVDNCYIYQIYDAGITHQITTNGKKIEFNDITYKNNLVEYCVYSIEYFLEMTDGDTQSYMKNIKMHDNVLRFSGYGWGQQRHNKHTPAHVKGWSYTNVAYDYEVYNNVFDRSAFRLLHLVALKDEYCPTMHDNTYIQNAGGMIGQYGGNEKAEPQIEFFDEDIVSKITNIFKDKNAKIYEID